MKVFEKINRLSKGKRIAIKVILFILIWNIVLLPAFLITNNCANNVEKKWFFEEAEKFIRTSEEFSEEYGNIISIEYVDVMLDKDINNTVAILTLKTEKNSSIECIVVFEPKSPNGGAVYPSFYRIK